MSQSPLSTDGGPMRDTEHSRATVRARKFATIDTDLGTDFLLYRDDSPTWRELGVDSPTSNSEPEHEDIIPDHDHDHDHEHKPLNWERLQKLFNAKAKIEQSLRALNKEVKEKVERGKEVINKNKRELQTRMELRKKRVKRLLVDEQMKLKKKLRVRALNMRINYNKHIRLIDKLGFLVGILHSWITVYLLAAHPAIVVNWLAYWTVALIGIRVVIYRFKRWHYFMFDFCYFMNTMLVFYVFFLSHSEQMFFIVFALANGPLLWAIVFWRNSLVLHDLDKMSSLFVHCAGPIITYALRWAVPHSHAISQLSTFSYCQCNDPNAPCECTISFTYAMLVPLLPYLVWQCGYYMKTELSMFRISKSIPAGRDDTIATSFKFITAIGPNKASPVGRILAFLNWDNISHQRRVVYFMLYQLIYTVIVILPIKFMFESFVVHCVVAWLVIVVCVWNGANYYFEVFAKRYENEYKKKADTLTMDTETLKQLESEMALASTRKED